MNPDNIKSVKKFLLCVILFFALLFGFGYAYKAKQNLSVGGTEKSVGINSEDAMKNFVKGRWPSTRTFNGMVVYYRYEITDNQIKYWSRGSTIEWGREKSNWESNPEETISYSIGELQTDSYGNQKRMLAEGNFGTIILKVGKDGEPWLERVTQGGEDDYFEKGWKENE